MSNRELFQAAYGYPATSEDATPISTPLDDISPVATTKTTPAERHGDILGFAGYSSGMPLLLDKPSRCLYRMRTGIQNLIVPAANEQTPDDWDKRTLYSPIVSLPVPLLYGGEKLCNDMVEGYPFFYAPTGRHPQPGQKVDEYFLTLYLLYTTGDCIHENTDGELLSIPFTPNIEASDEAWNDASNLAASIKPALAWVNTARAVRFAIADPAKETEPLNRLFDLWRMYGFWNEQRSIEDIITCGDVAAEHLAPYYEQLTGSVPDFYPTR